MANTLTATVFDLIQDNLEGVRSNYAPEPTPLPKGLVLVPFAVMAWDDGLDIDCDGNAWQDSPPCEFIHTAHKTLESAEAELARVQGLCPNTRFWLNENHIAHDWEVDELDKWR